MDQPSRVGPYDLLEPVGEGGMATVFRARAPDGAEVAVKVLAPAAFARDERALQRFRREVEIVSGLSHPRLIALLDHGVDETAGPYMVMPLVRGITLRDLCAGEPLCPEAAIVLMLPVIEAVAVLHEAGVVHRDLKPDNVIVSPVGDVTLIDLGLALSGDHTRYTTEGEVAGSVPYMAPELLEGEAVTRAADVWALGVMLYELMAGRRPFARSRPSEEAGAILAGAFERLSEVDRRVSREQAALVASCLAADPAGRPESAGELRARLLEELDWASASALRAEVAAVATSPAGYQARVVSHRTRQLRSAAAAAIDTGDAFEALAILDRALAYAPEDEALLELVEEATDAAGRPEAPAVEAAPAPPRRRTWLGPALGGIGLLAFVGLAWSVWPGHSEAPSPEAAVDAALGAPDSPVVDSGEPRPVDAGAVRPVEGLRPIDPAALTNEGPVTRMDLTAAPGEPLVPPGYLGADSPEQELAAREEALRRTPDDAAAVVAHAMALLAVGRTEEGMAALSRAADQWPEHPAAHTALGYIALRRGEHDEADRHLSRAIEIDPRHKVARRLRGILRNRLGHVRDGYADLVVALEQDPDSYSTLAELTYIYETAGRVSDAVPLLERLVEVVPTNADAWTDLAIAYGDTDRAQEAVTRALTVDPESVRAHQRHCELRAKRQQPEAVEACTEALARRPDDVKLLMMRAMGWAVRDDMPRALTDMDRAVSLAPGNPLARFNRHIMRGRSGDVRGAMEDLRAACDLGHVGACSQLGR